MAVAAWYIWWERREKKKEVRVKPPSSTTFAMSVITANSIVKTPHHHESKFHWEKPPVGTYKMNKDADVLRNSSGEALAGVAEVFDHAPNPAAEAMAIWRGLQLLQDIACSRLSWKLIVWRSSMHVMESIMFWHHI